MKFKDNLEVRTYEEFTSRSIKYCAEVTHSDLLTYRVLTSSDEYILDSKLSTYLIELEIKWNKKQEQERQLDNHGLAEKRTVEAIDLLKQCESLLKQTLIIDDTIKWDDLKKVSRFLFEIQEGLWIKGSTR